VLLSPIRMNWQSIPFSRGVASLRVRHLQEVIVSLNEAYAIVFVQVRRAGHPGGGRYAARCKPSNDDMKLAHV
jgi:hypothetical protein